MASRTRIAGHRGGAGLWPENSLLAFSSAVALGVDLLELDVHRTADGQAAVIHDAGLERTTEGTGPVAARTAAELQALRLRAADGQLTDERVPMLEDVVATVAPSGVGLLVEVKGPARGERYEGLEAHVVALLGRAGVADRATVMAFNPAVLEQVHACSPRLPTTLLVSARQVAAADARATAAVGWALAVGATDLGLEHTAAEAGVIERAHAAGLRIGVWTVDDETRMRELAGLGVDILTTDRPDRACRVLRARS